MSVARSLERRLERLLDNVAGRVFSGRLHPSEIAAKLSREVDFARFEHETGTATANRYVILVHPRDLSFEPGELEQTLTEEMSAYAAEEGLRLEGPVSVTIEATKEVSPGTVTCHVEIEPGDPVPWARLVDGEVTIDVGRNRAMIGRSEDADVVLRYDDVSRRHALLWRKGESAWLRDLSSSNGTTVDGVRAGADDLEVKPGSVIGFSDHRYRFMEL